jgi:ribosome-binding factor A
MSNRLLRVNELMQREISAFLHSRYSAEAVSITITGVDITGDLREAKVYYAVLGEQGDLDRAGRFLKSKLPEIRGVVARNVVIKHVPLLSFVPDATMRRTVRVEQLLDELERKDTKA